MIIQTFVLIKLKKIRQFNHRHKYMGEKIFFQIDIIPSFIDNKSCNFDVIF